MTGESFSSGIHIRQQPQTTSTCGFKNLTFTQPIDRREDLRKIDTGKTIGQKRECVLLPSTLTRRTVTLGEDGGPNPITDLHLPTTTSVLDNISYGRNCGFFTMPSRLSTPVLTVDAGKIHKVDTASVQSLHGMWMGECSILPVF